MPLIGYFESCNSPFNMSYPLLPHKIETIMTEFMFWKSFGELIGQLVISAYCHYFNFKLFNIYSGELVRDGNVFGLRLFIRDCDRFKTCAVIFMDDRLGNFSKGFGYCVVFSMYLGIFDDYIVELLKQFTNTSQFIHGFRQGNIISIPWYLDLFGFVALMSTEGGSS